MIRWLGSVIMRRHGSSQGQGGGGDGGVTPPGNDSWLWAAGGTDSILWAAGGTDVILLESTGAGAGTAMGLLLSLTYAS